MLKISLFILIGWNLTLYAEIPHFKPYAQNLISKGELTQFVMSEKLDGVRGIWNGKNLKTRKDNLIQVPKFWLVNFPPFVLDGELWLTYNHFEKISSIVRDSVSDESKWQEMTYQVFDVRGVCEKCSLSERLNYLENYLKDFPNPYIKIIPQIPIKNHQHLESYYQEILSKGGEGVILRRNSFSDIGYKLKPFADAECIVRGYTQGKGKNINGIGAIWCEGEVLGEKKYFKIGSGFSSAMRLNPPKIDTIITYKYQGYTKNKLPRFPIFLRIREDGI
ncbi:DNA ligase [Helicobacter ganmani]|uniref:DNA ligase n=1 Tax=Helicobacter ganmani TaxID=60246 RepID=A0A3D8ID63_9HELI|nr:DNA ligase [Helicobacter ganmani]